MATHPVHRLLYQPFNTEAEAVLLNALIVLSATTFQGRSIEFIYDVLIPVSHKPSSNAPIYWALQKQLNRIEEITMATQAGVVRLQNDSVAFQKVLTDLQAQLAVLLQAQTDAEARLEADIAALRSQGGNGDPTALDAIADSLESTMAAFSSVTSQLTAAAQAQVAVDPIPAPVATEPAPAPVATEPAPATTEPTV